MPSPAQKQAEAIADVERLAEELYETGRRHSPGHWLPWKAMDPTVHEAHRGMVRDLLHRDVFRVGRRPPADAQLVGQTSIDDELSP